MGSLKRPNLMQDDIVVRRKESLQLWYLVATNAKCSSTATQLYDRRLIHAGSRRDGIASDVPINIRNAPSPRGNHDTDHNTSLPAPLFDSDTWQFSERDQSVQIENIWEKIASKIQNALSCRHSEHSNMFHSQKPRSNRYMQSWARRCVKCDTF